MESQRGGENQGPAMEGELHAVVVSFLDRLRRGERPSIGEYTEKYPELAGVIRDLLPALDFLDRAGQARVHGGETQVPGAASPGASESAAAAESSEAAAAKPVKLGEYRILREIGHGGMGIVYEAEQESLGRRVALKVLPYHRLWDAKRLERFRREARAAASLKHPAIVPIYTFGESEGLPYYAMEYVLHSKESVNPENTRTS